MCLAPLQQDAETCRLVLLRYTGQHEVHVKLSVCLRLSWTYDPRGFGQGAVHCLRCSMEAVACIFIFHRDVHASLTSLVEIKSDHFGFGCLSTRIGSEDTSETFLTLIHAFIKISWSHSLTAKTFSKHYFHHISLFFTKSTSLPRASGFLLDLKELYLTVTVGSRTECG